MYKIHGGPMAGRTNFQTCSFQCIRPGELWQCNWLEGAIPRPRHHQSLQRLMGASPQRRGLSSHLSTTFPGNESRRFSLSPKVLLLDTLILTKQPDADEAVQGHWGNAQAALGDKRNPADLERWRGLARIGIQTDRHMLPRQADIVDVFKGKGDLEPVEQSWPTL